MDFSTIPPVFNRMNFIGGIPVLKGNGKNSGTPSSVNESMKICETKPIMKDHQTILMSTMRMFEIAFRNMLRRMPISIVPTIECDMSL